MSLNQIRPSAALAEYHNEAVRRAFFEKAVVSATGKTVVDVEHVGRCVFNGQYAGLEALLAHYDAGASQETLENGFGECWGDFCWSEALEYYVSKKDKVCLRELCEKLKLPKKEGAEQLDLSQRIALSEPLCDALQGAYQDAFESAIYDACLSSYLSHLENELEGVSVIYDKKRGRYIEYVSIETINEWVGNNDIEHSGDIPSAILDEMDELISNAQSQTPRYNDVYNICEDMFSDYLHSRLDNVEFSEN